MTCFYGYACLDSQRQNVLNLSIHLFVRCQTQYFENSESILLQFGKRGLQAMGWKINFSCEEVETCSYMMSQLDLETWQMQWLFRWFSSFRRILFAISFLDSRLWEFQFLYARKNFKTYLDPDSSASLIMTNLINTLWWCTADKDLIYFYTAEYGV